MIRATGLSVVYPGGDGGHILDGLDFQAAHGERIALLGANGAGKSTLLLSLVGILPIHDGSITVNGRNLDGKNLTPIRRDLGLVFQNPDDQLFMNTVMEDVLFGPLNYLEHEKCPKTELPVRRAALESAARALLDDFGIGHLAQKMPHKLSGGEKRLAALASVFIMEPQAILMDEPSAFLDPRARKRLISILASRRETLIIATHDLDLARSLCPRSILLHSGRIQADASTETILADTVLLERCALM